MLVSILAEQLLLCVNIADVVTWYTLAGWGATGSFMRACH